MCCCRTCPGRQDFACRCSPSSAGPASHTPGTCAPRHALHGLRTCGAAAGCGLSALKAHGCSASRATGAAHLCSRQSRLYPARSMAAEAPSSAWYMASSRSLQHLNTLPSSIRSLSPAWHAAQQSAPPEQEAGALAWRCRAHPVGGEDEGLHVRVLPQLGHVQPVWRPLAAHCGTHEEHV